MKKGPGGSLKPIYLVHGEEEMLIDEALKRLRRKLGTQSQGELDFDNFDGTETGADEIIQAANTIPFCEQRRLVVVRNADKLLAGEVRKLVKYAEDPSPSTCLVLVAKKVKTGDALTKAVSKTGEVAEYKNKQSLVSRVRLRFEEHGQRVSDNTAKYIVQTAGKDMRRLYMEVDKIALFGFGQKVIELEDVMAIISHTDESTIFNLVDYLGDRKVATALTCLRHLLERKSDPVNILFLMVRQFRLILRAKILVDKGVDSRRLAEVLTGGDKRLPSFVVSKCVKQSRNFTLGELKIIFDRLLEADAQLKTGAGRPWLVLETLVIKVAG